MTRGFYLGRFQPFHLGHLQDVNEALKEVDQLIIAIGSSGEKRTDKNPFSVAERIKMISNTLVSEGIAKCKIYPVPDIGDHTRYVEHVETLVPEFDRVFTGSDFTQKLFEAKGYSIVPVKMLLDISGSEIRRRMKDDEDWTVMVPPAVVSYLEEIHWKEILESI